MGGKRKKFQVHTWQLILILLPLLFILATLLRLDHITMTELRAAVLEADEVGDDEAIATSLAALQKFTFSHTVVNIVDNNGGEELTFGTGVFYLEQSYLRAAEAALEQAESELSGDSNPNGNIYAAAAATCKPQAIANRWAWNSTGYINCMTSEIAKYPAADTIEDQIKANIPSTELYRYNYSSPIWTPTASGFVAILCAIVIVVIFIRFLLWLLFRLSLFFLKN